MNPKERDELISQVNEAIKSAKEQYECECFDADWFNNNTPNVGTGNIQYKQHPQYPKSLELLEKIHKYLLEQ